MTLQQLRYAEVVAKVGSMNEAARRLYVSQPSLSEAIRGLEKTVGIKIFNRVARGVVLTPEGEEFMGYARQILNQVDLLEDKYSDGNSYKKKFGVSTQHYSFAVKAFVELAKELDSDQYELAVRETRTYDVVSDVANSKSDVGILYLNNFNRKVLEKIFREKDLEWIHLFDCDAYVYLCKQHPLAKKKKLTLEQLSDYPCLSFEQGDNNSFYFAEEVMSTYDYKQIIKACDRATMLNLMVGLNGYTLCSGVISEDLNGSAYMAIPLDEDVVMEIGYIKKKDIPLSIIGELYIKKLHGAVPADLFKTEN